MYLSDLVLIILFSVETKCSYMKTPLVFDIEYTLKVSFIFVQGQRSFHIAQNSVL